VQLITSRDRWTVIVPLKASSRGKSRIEVDPTLRRRLALVMAMDTVAAASAAAGVAGVVVVAEDRADGERLSEIAGVRIQATRTADLNSAIRDGLISLGRGFAGPVAVLPGDLPSLTATELDTALAAARRHRLAVVGDRQGTGTTLLTSASHAALRPQYGSCSLRLHVAAGAVPLEVPIESGLRRDVDRAADLADQTGPRTAALLAASGCGFALCAARAD